MVTSDVRQKIQKLVDEANVHQLGAVLEVLTPTTSRNTQEEINSFYNRVKLFEERGSKGSTVEEAHANIRSKYKKSMLHKLIVSSYAKLNTFDAYK